jgi:hypothetical protein
MLPCKQKGCYWHLVYLTAVHVTAQQTNYLPEEHQQMSKTASFPLASSASLFNRIMVSIDRLLMAHARIATRNGDLPYFGL